jgi:sarcosine/dimethylglycine N-methyltransferase
MAPIAEEESTSTGDFSGKQFSEEEVAKKVQEQYGEEHARTFYTYVMGGGGQDIHYGIYRAPEDGVFESSKATNKKLLETLDWTLPVTKDSLILDLGSGHGGLSHDIALKFGCQVLSFNLSPEQNNMNVQEATRLGVADNISVQAGNFNQGLPDDWTHKFTHVVSCEVFCHAASKPALLTEIHRCLQPGGALVFTDIMGADGADEKALKDFTDRNATTEMARPSGYRQQLAEAAFLNVGFWDGSCHLIHYFKGMLDVCLTQRDAMMADGVPGPYLDKWVAALTDRCEIQGTKKVFAWGIFSARKDGPVF